MTLINAMAAFGTKGVAVKKSASRANEGGTSCQPQGKSANTTRKTAPALPNEQTTRRFVQCCLCLRYNGNWPRNEK